MLRRKEEERRALTKGEDGDCSEEEADENSITLVMKGSLLGRCRFDVCAFVCVSACVRFGFSRSHGIAVLPASPSVRFVSFLFIPRPFKFSLLLSPHLPHELDAGVTGTAFSSSTPFV